MIIIPLTVYTPMQEDILCKDRVACSSSGANTDCIHSPGHFWRWSICPRKHRLDRTKLGLCVFRSSICYFRAVWTKQCGGEPQHSHYQHPYRILPFRPSRSPDLRLQWKKLNHHYLAAWNGDVHGEEMLPRDFYMVGLHLFGGISFKLPAVPED